MCTDCGCGLPDGVAHAHPGEPAGVAAHHHGAGRLQPEHVAVMHHLLAENDRLAAHNREHFARHGVLAINLMSSPGSGKTALLEATAVALAGTWRMGVLVGDLETDNDAVRIRAHGIPAVQISTGSACHLDAAMVHEALHELDLDSLDVLFIENVGNLVCPASFDLGQHHNVTLLSVTEGDDKPAKYPVMFRAADLVLLSKSDLLALLDDFDPGAAEQALRALASDAPLLRVASRRQPQLDAWLDWLRTALARQR